MARELSQILTELNNVYNPQRDIYNKQISALDPQQQAEQKGLQAAKQDAFAEIDTGANRRGLFYSGIPIGEQQRYTGSTFLPAVANLHAKYAQQKFNLQDALAKITQDQYNSAYGIRQKEIDSENAAAAARAAGSGGGGLDFSGLGGGGGGTDTGTAAAGSGYSCSQRGHGAFSFVGPNGQPISAAQYSQATGVPFRQLLQTMANAGDGGARNALAYVGGDYGFDRSKVKSQDQLNLLRALGINTGGYRIPAPAQRGPVYPGQSAFGKKNTGIIKK